MPDNQIGLEAVFENEDFQRGIDDYNRAVSDADQNTQDAGGSMSAVWEGLSAVGAVAFAAIAVGIAAMTTELYAAVSAAFDAEDAMARVNFVVSETADRTGVTTDEVAKLADSLSSVLPIDDEVIAQAIAMGLTFDGVNQDNIQPLIGAAADLAAWTGKDLPSAMKDLSLSITDSDRAMRLFKEANITLTDEEKKTLKGMGDLGDTAGVTTFILDQLARKGILGLGEVMGDTAKGKFEIMQTAIGNLQEALGEGLLDTFKDVFSTITDFAKNPATIEFFTNLGKTIGSLASYFIAVVQDGDSLNDFLSHLPEGIQPVVKAVGEFVAALRENLPKAFQWLKDNQPIIIGILAAIGVAMLAFAATSAAAAIATAASFAPVIAILAVIAAVVAVFVKAWQDDWGGIQEKVAAAWAQVKPIFEQLQAWLKVNLPKAIKLLSDYWNKVLLPAVKVAIGWIADNVLPLLVKLVLWLGDNVPKAIKKLSDFWTGTLLPAMQDVGNWISGTLIPLFEDVFEWLATDLPKAIKTLSDFWTNTLLPAIRAVSDFFTNTLIPTFQNIATFISTIFTAALTTLAALWTNVLLPALNAVWSFISNNLLPIFNAVANLIDAVLSVALRVLAGLWQNVLLPAIQAVYNFIKNNLIAIFNSVRDTMAGPLSIAIENLRLIWEHLKDGIQKLWDKLEPFRTFLAGVFKSALNGIWDVIQKIITKINEWADAIRNLQLPDWLTPGSPTPFEIGLDGINEQLKKMASISLPAIRQQMEILATVRDVPSAPNNSAAGSISNNSQSTRNYLFGTQFNIPNATGIVESLQGL